MATTVTPAHSTGDGSAGMTPRMRLMRAPMDIVTETSAVQTIVDAAEAGIGHWTVTANLDHVRRYNSDPITRSLVDEADLVVADGMPLIWASRMVGKPLPERVAGSRMVWSICEAASARRQSIFLLGGDPTVAGRAGDIFQDRYPDLDIVGTTCPPVGFQNDETQLSRIRNELAEANPAIVFVALGFPKQDLLIRELRRTLPQASFLGVGISLSYVTGDVSPAPDWMCNIGLEWAYRLWQDPRRLVQRYVVNGMPFALRMMMSAVWHRARYGKHGASQDWSVA
jgi:N-acetylglucosaminyldiphosphoundecaprenol N-acetyl-beta-D-mannosaminyltransferase